MFDLLVRILMKSWLDVSSLVEKKKVQRNIKKLEKLVKGKTESIEEMDKSDKKVCKVAKKELASLQEKLEAQRLNMLYVRFYLKDYKYISLFPSNPEQTEDLRDSNDSFREAVKSYLKEAHERGDMADCEFCVRYRDVFGSKSLNADGEAEEDQDDFFED